MNIRTKENEKGSVWFAVVELKSIQGKETVIKNALGAFINVAYLANDENHFKDKIRDTFKENNFEVLDIDDVESLDTISIDDAENAEKLELLQDVLEEEYDFSWGVFHTYDE